MSSLRQRDSVMKILVGFDGSDGARAAVEDLRHAGLPSNAEASVIACADVPLDPPFYSVVAVEGGGVVPQSAIEAMREQTEREMRRAAAAASAGADLLSSVFPGWTVRSDSAQGSPYWHIVETAKRWHADLVVVGAHARSPVARWFFGSVSQNVLAHAPCSVRVGRAGPALGGGAGDGAPRVLLAVDGSPHSAASVDAICARTWPSGTEIRVAAAVDLRLSMDLTTLLDTGGERGAVLSVQRLLQVTGERLRDCKLACTASVLEGNPKQALVEEAERWGAECIVLGARGHSRLERFLIGSVSASVAARAHCSVEVIRPSH